MQEKNLEKPTSDFEGTRNTKGNNEKPSSQTNPCTLVYSDQDPSLDRLHNSLTAMPEYCWFARNLCNTMPSPSEACPTNR